MWKQVIDVHRSGIPGRLLVRPLSTVLLLMSNIRANQQIASEKEDEEVLFPTFYYVITQGLRAAPNRRPLGKSPENAYLTSPSGLKSLF